MKEEWRDIEGHEGKYQVSNFGRIRNSIRNKILKQTKVRNNYLVVSLHKNKQKRFYVHRLVAIAFIPNNNNLSEVNHKDENKENNHVDNLEWCNKEYNLTYGTRIDRISNKKRGVPKSPEAKQKISKTRIKNKSAKGANNPNCKKVILLTTSEIFDYMNQAAEKYGIYKDSIRRCCQGKFKYAGKLENGAKLIWMYYEDYIKLTNNKDNLQL